jgi:tetratricopeptide (TPR) repeat protein
MKRRLARCGGAPCTRNLLASAALLAAFAAPIDALAQDVSSPTATDDAATRDAKARFDEGLKRYEKGDFEGARVAFQQAYAVLHAVDILYNLALSELRSNRPVEALHHLQEYVKDKRVTEEERSKASKYLAEAHGKTGHVFVEAPSGSVVLMDDQALDKKAPIKDPVDVTSGKHVCQVRLPDKTQTVEVIAQPGQSVTVRFGGESPIVTEGPTTGPDGVDHPPSGSTPSTGKIATIVGLSAAAVGAIIGGVIFKLGQDSARSDAQDISSRVSCGGPAPPPDCATLKDKGNTYDTDRTLAVIFFAGGAALAAGAIATIALWPNEKSQPIRGSHLTPVLSAGGGGLVWSGSF